MSHDNLPAEGGNHALDATVAAAEVTPEVIAPATEHGRTFPVHDLQRPRIVRIVEIMKRMSGSEAVREAYKESI